MARSVFPVESFPALGRFVDAWPVIRSEALALDQSERCGFTRDGLSHEEVLHRLIGKGKPTWIEGWGLMRDRWLNYGLAFMDMFPFGDAACPTTVGLLRELRGIKVAAFSVFKPLAFLDPHDHPELVDPRTYTFHLGLEGPDEHACLNVAGEYVEEKPGHAFVFDGSQRHFAYNMSERDRVIFYMEFFADRLEVV